MLVKQICIECYRSQGFMRRSLPTVGIKSVNLLSGLISTNVYYTVWHDDLSRIAKPATTEPRSTNFMPCYDGTMNREQ